LSEEDDGVEGDERSFARRVLEGVGRGLVVAPLVGAMRIVGRGTAALSQTVAGEFIGRRENRECASVECEFERFNANFAFNENNLNTSLLLLVRMFLSYQPRFNTLLLTFSTFRRWSSRHHRCINCSFTTAAFATRSLARRHSHGVFSHVRALAAHRSPWRARSHTSPVCCARGGSTATNVGSSSSRSYICSSSSYGCRTNISCCCCCCCCD
jgi:hypothetical protein